MGTRPDLESIDLPDFTGRVRTMVTVNPLGRGMPSDKGVDWFAQIDRADIPDWLAWLHVQATLGYANKTTKRQAGFNITPEDCQIVPELDEFYVVLLGYGL